MRPSWGVRRGALSALLISTSFYALSVAAQDVVVSPNQGPNGPTVQPALNGTPVINIASPNSGGVSNNEFTTLNVSSQGLVTVNTASSSNSILAGQVDGNPNVLNGTAGVIVMRDHNPSGSLIQGAVENIGQRAEMVFINENNIRVQGAEPKRFYNIDRVTFSTGLPQYDAAGNLTGYGVESGEINLSGGVLGDAETDLSLIGKTIVVGNEVEARNLNIVAGANQVQHGTFSATPLDGYEQTGAVMFLRGSTTRAPNVRMTITGEGFDAEQARLNAFEEFFVETSGEVTAGVIESPNVTLRGARGVDARTVVARESATSQQTNTDIPTASVEVESSAGGIAISRIISDGDVAMTAEQDISLVSLSTQSEAVLQSENGAVTARVIRSPNVTLRGADGVEIRSLVARESTRSNSADAISSPASVDVEASAGGIAITRVISDGDVALTAEQDISLVSLSTQSEAVLQSENGAVTARVIRSPNVTLRGADGVEIRSLVARESTRSNSADAISSPASVDIETSAGGIAVTRILSDGDLALMADQDIALGHLSTDSGAVLQSLNGDILIQTALTKGDLFAEAQPTVPDPNRNLG